MPDTYKRTLVQCPCGCFYLRMPAPAGTWTESFACEQCGFVLSRWRGGFGAVVFERAIEATKTG